jgi:hypothetical protein
MNNRKKFLLLLIVWMAMPLSGCKTTTPVGISSSIAPMHNKKIVKQLGHTSGSDSAYSLLSLWMIGKPDTEAAIQQALEKKGADTLVNIKIYETYTTFGLWSVTTVIVEGDALQVSGVRK